MSIYLKFSEWQDFCWKHSRFTDIDLVPYILQFSSGDTPKMELKRYQQWTWESGEKREGGWDGHCKTKVTQSLHIPSPHVKLRLLSPEAVLSKMSWQSAEEDSFPNPPDNLTFLGITNNIQDPLNLDFSFTYSQEHNLAGVLHKFNSHYSVEIYLLQKPRVVSQGYCNPFPWNI